MPATVLCLNSLYEYLPELRWGLYFSCFAGGRSLTLPKINPLPEPMLSLGGEYKDTLQPS